MSAILEFQGVSRRFGGLRAVSEVDLAVQPGEILGLIGPNGAGKTTLVNLATGVYRPNSGEIRFDGQRIDHLPSYRIARLGIARTYQVVQPFPDMTVVENVAAAVVFATRETRMQAALDIAMDKLAFVGLAEVAHYRARELTLANRKRLEFAKSLAMRPRVLLLDEVNAGLNPTEIERAVGLMRAIAAEGITIVIIEHLMKVVMSLCSRIVVLHHGELIAGGAPEQVAADPVVIQAYLGSRYARRAEGAGGDG